VQAALFAGFLSAFLIELLSRLEPDPMDTIQDVLIYQTQMMRNSSLGPYVPTDFSPPEYIVVVNALFYASLGIMLLAAFIAMLIKSWVREFDRGLQAMSLPEQRAKTREFRYLGLEYWKLSEMVAILPLLIQLSLLLFFIGLVVFLFYISKPSFGVTMSIFGVGIVYYAVTASISVFVTSSPFRSPVSRAFRKVYRQVHDYFCPGVRGFSSPEMDTTPATAPGRLRRHIQIFLTKWRPFLERNFEEPITATMLDEVQISTTMSALKRIHESVPNSQNSGTLQCSVWQVVGGPAFRIPPSFGLPPWILDKSDDEEFLSRLPPAMVIALAAFWLRAPTTWAVYFYTAARWLPRPVNVSESLWAQLVYGVFDVSEGLRHQSEYGVYKRSADMIQAGSNELADISRWGELRVEECSWLLNTLSELHGVTRKHPGLLSVLGQPFFIGICLAMISQQALKWFHRNTPDIVLLDAVVTLLAVSCIRHPIDLRETLTNSSQSPWLLLNLRNPELINKMIEDVPSACHKQLISLLFLIIYGLILRDSNLLAVQYFGIITVKDDFPLYASALTAVAPALRDYKLLSIGRMLVAPQTEDLASKLSGFSWFHVAKLLQEYDHQLGASQNPDPNVVAILLIPSKRLHLIYHEQPRSYIFKLKNPWLILAARVIERLDIPGGSAMDIVSFGDRRVHNMLAALYLLQYSSSPVPRTFFWALFLKSREFVISSLALKYYLMTIMYSHDPLEPSRHLTSAVRAVFNHLLPDHQLQIGWPILVIFMDGFKNPSVNWRQTFAEAFFTRSYQPLPRQRGGAEATTPESELENILTWEYFHEEEQEPQYTDLGFSGLDWMAMAWSLRLSQRPRTFKVGYSNHGIIESQIPGAPVINEEFVLRALSELLDAAPYYKIAPIIPKIREFVEWFGDPSLSEYRGMISVRIEEVDRIHEEFHQFYQFHSFHCTWYI